jgi:hypothetical protein
MEACNRLWKIAMDAHHAYEADPTLENRQAMRLAAQAHGTQLNEMKTAVQEAKTLERQQQRKEDTNNESRNGTGDAFSSPENSTRRVPRHTKRVTAVGRDAPGHD